ncbi:MAG: rhomboid family intramembrane serine protease [Opitutales bacterium]
MASLKEFRPELLLPEDFNTPAGWCPVAAYDSAEAAHEAGLSVLAMGQAYWLIPHQSVFVLCVAREKVDAVRSELDSIARLGKRPVHHGGATFHEFTFGPAAFVVYALFLSAVFIWQQFHPIQLAGCVDASAMVEQHEWWRAVTSLTLHGDIVHLVSNLVAGLGFAFFVARFFGAGCAWFLILLSGAFGNALNAYLHYPEVHLSIGASTGVFGALGIITGIGLWAALVQPAEHWTFPPWLWPVFGGLTLMGLLGVGEELDGRIDVAAHISGFLCGAVLGLVGALCQADLIRFEHAGPAIGLFSMGLIGLSWILALH